MRLLHIWHRRLGITALLVILIVSVTGLALTILPGSELGRSEVDWEPVQKLYGKSPKVGPICSKADEMWICQIDQGIYTPSQFLAQLDSGFVGAIAYQGGYAVATATKLWVFTSEGAAADEIDSLLLPGTVLSIGTNPAGGVFLRIGTADISEIYRGTPDLTFWEAVDSDDVSWSAVGDAPGDVVSAVLTIFRGAGVPVYRLVLDLHTGRLFGIVGIVLVWIGTVLLIALAISGAWMWAKRLKD